jgi:predicted extracellular nuclease
VTFSEPVDATDAAFELRCGGVLVPTSVEAGSDGTQYTLDPATDLPRGTSCTVTVRAAGVSDRDTDDPPDRPRTDFSSSFTTAPLTGLRIHDIQGASHVSPYRDRAVAGVPGVVTARRGNGYFVQDPQPDGDARTSEGIFVFTGSAPDPALTPGTAVTLTGNVAEFRGGGASSANLATTELTSATATPAGTGTIAATLVGRGGRVPPTTVVEDDVVDPGGEDPTTNSGDVEQGDPLFDPDEDGIDFYESLEGMLTEVRNATVVGPTSVFGSGASENREIPVLADGGDGATICADRGPVLVRGFDSIAPQEFRRGDMNPERITLNDANDPDGAFLPPADVRDRFTSPVRSIVDYSFGNYKFLVVNRPALADGALKPETTRKKKRDELAVASYNVENLDGLDDQERYDRVAAQIVGNLRAPDILSLEEIQDNDGAPNEAPTNAEVTYQRLIAAIEAAGGPRYDYRQVDPAPGQDGGEPGGNIRVAFLFRTDNPDLHFVDRGTATAITPTEPVAGPDGRPQLTLSPGRVDPTNPVFNNSRKPLAGEFSYRGRPLFIVGNHFASKGGDDPVFGRFQEPRRPSERQRRGSATDPADTTRGQAGVVNTFVRKLLDIDSRAHVLVLGDLNDFDFSETVRVLARGADREGLELVDLWHFVPQDERYSYIFQGNGQVLDHILVSPALGLDGRPDVDAVHINAEFNNQVSDHDPPITRFDVGP